jgi:hypothetical protein
LRSDGHRREQHVRDHQQNLSLHESLPLHGQLTAISPIRSGDAAGRPFSAVPRRLKHTASDTIVPAT